MKVGFAKFHICHPTNKNLLLVNQNIHDGKKRFHQRFLEVILIIKEALAKLLIPRMKRIKLVKMSYIVYYKVVGTIKCVGGKGDGTG